MQGRSRRRAADRPADELLPDRFAYAELRRRYDLAVVGQLTVRQGTLHWQGRERIRYEAPVAPLDDDAATDTLLIGFACGQ